MMGEEEALRAALRLHLAEGVGALTFKRLVEAFGGPEAAVAAGPAGWRRVEGIGGKTCQAMQAVGDDEVEAELAEAAKHHVRLLSSSEGGYPAALKGIHDPPPVLYVWGELVDSDAVAMAVVGARRSSYYGLEQGERFGGLLGRAGFTVVSGGARGIDTAAHRGALAAGGRTIAVMGCGLGRTYPSENAELFEQIAAGGRGAVVSELPMSVGVKGENFPKRNRIISGLSLGVLVVEAAHRSGTLITAREAIEQGREVFAVPGRVDSPTSQGTNELIRNHATLVQDLDDVLAELGDVGSLMAPLSESDDEDASVPGLSEDEQKLVDALRDGEQGVDELVRRTGMASAAVAASLTMLAIKGLVAQRPGQVFALKRR